MPKKLQGQKIGNHNFFNQLISSYVAELNSMCTRCDEIGNLKFKFSVDQNIEFKLVHSNEVIFRLQKMYYKGTNKEIFAVSPNLTNTSYSSNNGANYYKIITTAYYFVQGKLSLNDSNDLDILIKLSEEFIKGLNNNSNIHSSKKLISISGYNKHPTVYFTDIIKFKDYNIGLGSGGTNGNNLGNNASSSEKLEILPNDQRSLNSQKANNISNTNIINTNSKTITVIKADSRKWYNDFVGQSFNVVPCTCNNKKFTYKLTMLEFQRVLLSEQYKSNNMNIRGLAFSCDDIQ
jgi:hypothetical protein